MIHAVVASEKLDNQVNQYTNHLLANSPQAVASSKELLDFLGETKTLDAEDYTAGLIARLRVSDEGQEGIQAFFEKRKPQWFKKHEE